MPSLNEDQRALASMIDHTLLKADATPAMISQLCAEARKYNFHSVCVNPCYVALANKELIGTTIKVCTVIGFPLGATYTETKVAEAREAIRNGAAELDMVLNVGHLIVGDAPSLRRDVEAVVAAARKGAATVKVIIETALLNEEQKILACEIVSEAGADFIKTSTGFAGKGATVEDVELLRRNIGPGVKVKASGGIRDVDFALDLVDAGADRLGVSASVALIEALGD